MALGAALEDVVVVLSKEQAERQALAEALVARDVEPATARDLTADADPVFVREVLAAGEAKGAGPGWYVQALRARWRVAPAPRLRPPGRYTHRQALALLDAKGLSPAPHRPFDRFFAACRCDDGVWFELTPYGRRLLS